MYAGIDAGLKAQFEHFLTWACLSNKTSLAEVFTEAISAHRLVRYRPHADRCFREPDLQWWQLAYDNDRESVLSCPPRCGQSQASRPDRPYTVPSERAAFLLSSDFPESKVALGHHDSTRQGSAGYDLAGGPGSVGQSKEQPPYASALGGCFQQIRRRHAFTVSVHKRFKLSSSSESSSASAAA